MSEKSEKVFCMTDAAKEETVTFPKNRLDPIFIEAVLANMARRHYIGHRRHSGFDEFDKLYSPIDCPYCGGDLTDVHKESLS